MAPYYAGLYPELAEYFRGHGYALAIHGSLARDFDLVAVPWIEEPTQPQAVVRMLCQQYAFTQSGEPETKLHGRLSYAICTALFGECFLDLSFMPTTRPTP